MFVFDYFRGETGSGKWGKDKVLGFANCKQHQLLLFKFLFTKTGCIQKVSPGTLFGKHLFNGLAIE